jgi:hypothetical protein
MVKRCRLLTFSKCLTRKSLIKSLINIFQERPPPINYCCSQIESFELLLKLGKSSYRRTPVSSLFKIFWTPAFAGVTATVEIQSSQILNSQFTIVVKIANRNHAFLSRLEICCFQEVRINRRKLPC